MEVNGDLTARATAVARTMPWARREDGVHEKVFEQVGALRTAFVKLAPGATLPASGAGWLDIFVIGGSLREGEVVHPPNTFLHLPADAALRAELACTAFVKQRPARAPVRLAIDIRQARFHPTQNAGVHASWLYDEGDVAALLFHGVPSSAIAHHDHDSREEFLVLSGDLRDEHGAYAPSTWVRQPIGSVHTVETTAGYLFLAFAYRGEAEAARRS